MEHWCGVKHAGTSLAADFRGTLPSMADNWKCTQCDKEEQRCDCDKYCCLCQGSDNPRLCSDGLYYCRDCREVCGYIVGGDL